MRILGNRLNHVVPVQHLDIPNTSDTLPHMAFQKRPAGDVQRQGSRIGERAGPVELVAAHLHRHRGKVAFVAGVGTRGDQFVEQAGE